MNVLPFGDICKPCEQMTTIFFKSIYYIWGRWLKLPKIMCTRFVHAPKAEKPRLYGTLVKPIIMKTETNLMPFHDVRTYG